MSGRCKEKAVCSVGGQDDLDAPRSWRREGVDPENIYSLIKVFIAHIRFSGKAIKQAQRNKNE